MGDSEEKFVTQVIHPLSNLLLNGKQSCYSLSGASEMRVWITYQVDIQTIRGNRQGQGESTIGGRGRSQCVFLTTLRCAWVSVGYNSSYSFTLVNFLRKKAEFWGSCSYSLLHKTDVSNGLRVDCNGCCATVCKTRHSFPSGEMVAGGSWLSLSLGIVLSLSCKQGYNFSYSETPCFKAGQF